ncbi:P-loop ATPase, Sll1717 family [Vreelandella alkaliphila]|uniref:DNA repair protein n=1 Tax=Vreelandella alkaliphila TaxID=272774 RepID=A0ABX4HFW8_9GAMM|nr:P-loop NTPase fold protein [Halomonas humidisoli]PAU71357.1 DNA repair protein [Halomonas humidisoli]
MNNDIVIKKGIRLGELDAEADVGMLDYCFYDNGQIEDLLDVSSPRSIILGRTGSGKSALIYKISSEVEHSSILDPNDISVRFLEHSNIIQFFNELGVKLDLFYRILWRHLLTVELLKLRYNLRNESDNDSFLSRINEWAQRDTVKQRALSYFREWGDRFWLETDEQLRELTTKFTNDVKAKLGAKYAGVDISLEGAKHLSDEVKVEIRSLATQVVSAIQIKRLNEVLDLLADNAFEDKQKRYYVLIDKLDEDWAETETRCRFIRALIEETKALRKIPQVKIVTALRVDLLDLVFDRTRDSGFQEEKYDAYISKIIWTKNELKELLDSRVNEVYKRQYTSQGVHFSDIFPNTAKHGGGTAADYIIERTMLRPRDAIQFANECFLLAIGRPRISWRVLNAAESNYSQKRIKSLKEEWAEFYPCLESTIEIVRGLDNPFTRSSISNERLEGLAEDIHDGDEKDPCVVVCRNLYAPGSKVSHSEVLSKILISLYHVGVVGVKISTLDTYTWSHVDQPRLTNSEAKRVNSIKVHKMLRHALEIKDRKLLTEMGKKNQI